MMTERELLIHELAERAGISIRTIRYYIEEGLLPEPKYQGKYSYYTPSYMDRLELIRRLKDSYLPLKEIREIINSLTDEEVRRRLKESPQSSPKFSEQPKPPQARAKPGAKALEYIDRVTGEQNKYREKGTSPNFQLNSENEKDEWMFQQVQLQAPMPVGETGTWERITLAPGVELHLRQPLDPAYRHKIMQLYNYLKMLFE